MRPRVARENMAGLHVEYPNAVRPSRLNAVCRGDEIEGLFPQNFRKRPLYTAAR